MTIFKYLVFMSVLIIMDAIIFFSANDALVKGISGGGIIALFLMAIYIISLNKRNWYE